MSIKIIRIIIISLSCFFSTQLFALERIKDIATLQGVRENQLVGYGLVVGLDGTGDQVNQTIFTSQSFKNMLNKFGIRIPQDLNIQVKNVAAVMVIAQLPPFAKPGQKLDITVSSVGDSKSLRGGTLLMTSLKGADGQVYAIAQGNMLVSGVSAQGASGSKVSVNSQSSGTIPGGATIERPSPATFAFENIAVFNLNQSDFTTAARMADAINAKFSQAVAMPVDATSVSVKLPSNQSEQVMILAKIENIKLDSADSSAKIIINARSGTVVIGQHIHVKPTAVSHGNLSVTISETPFASQPQPFSLGQTKVLPNSQVQINQDKNHAFVLQPGVTLNDIVKAINSVGASPTDLMAILEALKSSGALQGDIVII